MAVELEVKCHECPKAEAIASLARRILEDHFGVMDVPEITISLHGDFLIPPHAYVNFLYYECSVPSDSVENGHWVCISMSPLRTPQSFLLGLAIAMSVARINSTTIIDEAGLLGKGRCVAPEVLQVQPSADLFEKTSEVVAQAYGVCQPKQ